MNKTYVRPKRVQGPRPYRLSQIERDRTGRNVAYGVPQFLERLVEWHRLKPLPTDDLPA